MFGFSQRQDLEKEIALPFKVVLEAQDDGTFLAKVPSLPGCTARGKGKSEAMRNAERAVRLHLASAAPASFDVVFEDPSQRVIHSLLPFFGRLVGSTNRDGALVSGTGDFGSWTRSPVSKGRGGPGSAFQKAEPEEAGPGVEEDSEGLLDFTPQIYCLAAFSGGGVAKLYAGTSSSGSVYESVDGAHWEPSTATGEERVHCLAEFKGRLYAGTSGSGKLFCYTGSHWSLVHRSSETALVSAGRFRGDLYIGTYPNGHIYASPDGINWHLACDSGQTFVRALVEFEGALYAATSRGSGGAVYRSDNGSRWEKVFEAKDPNFFCLHVFHHSLWLGSGNQGRLYRSDDGATWSLAASVEDEGIRSLASYEGRLYLATEGGGRIYRSRFAATPPPVLSAVRFEDVTSHSAVVSWRTDRPGDSRLLYGVGALDDSVHASASVTEHKLALGALKALTNYRVQVLSKGSDGSEAGFSPELEFSTTGEETAVLSSSSHPNGEAWSNRGDVAMQWTPPDGMVRFHWCVDRVPDTLPEPSRVGVHTTEERSAAFTVAEEGVWWFHLLCEDRAGNLGSEGVHHRLTLDFVAAPPRLASPSHPQDGAWSNAAVVSLAWEAPADLSGVQGYYVLLDRRPGTLPTPTNAAFIEEPRFKADLAEDGEWWFHAATLDSAGNVGGEASHYSFRLDRRADAPVVESPSHPDPERWYNTAQVLLRWSPPEDLSGITGYYTLLDQHPESVPGPHLGAFTAQESATFSGRGDGIWWFHIVSTDLAGNVGVEAAHRCVRIDTWAAPPRIASPTHPEGAWVSSGRVLVELTPSEDLSGTEGYYYLFDKDGRALPNAERGAYTADRSIEFNGLSDGLWHLRVVAKDLAGNVGVEAAHYSVRIDTEVLEPRPVSPTHAPEVWTGKRRAEMVWEAPPDLSGVARYYWLVDRDPGTVPTPLSGARCDETGVRVDLSGDGLWWFHVVAQDRAGNLSSAGHCPLKVDTEARAPRLLCPTHPDQDRWSADGRARFEWHEPEDFSGVAGYFWVFDRREDTVPGASSGTYTVERGAEVEAETDGEWWFHVSTKDGAGNLSGEASHFRLRIDTQAPRPRLHCKTHPDAEAWACVDRPVFAWEDGEDLSGIAGHYWVFDQDPGAPVPLAEAAFTEAGGLTLPKQKDGVWTFGLVAKDRAGNLSEAARVSLRIETGPPVSRLDALPALTDQKSFEVRWRGEDEVSGVASYDVQVREGERAPWKGWLEAVPGTSAAYEGRDGVETAFRVRAHDKAGNAEPWDEQGPWPHTLVDLSPPDAVETLEAKPGPAGCVVLTWAPSADSVSGVAGYEVWRSADAARPGSCVSPPDGFDGTAFTDPGSGLDDGALYHYTVRPYDRAGNRREEGNARVACVCDKTALPPVLSSPTHPDQRAWSRGTRAVVRWDRPADASGVVGYHWVLDQNPDTVPGEADAFTDTSELELPALKDGGWWLHVATKDLAGNLSREAGRYRLNVDTTPPDAPVVRCLSPASGAWSAEGDASFEWTVPADPAKIAGYHWSVDQKNAGVPGPEGGRYTTANSVDVKGLADGVWWFHVAAVDRAGNAGIQAGQCRVRVARTAPPPELSSPTHPRPSETYAGRTAAFHWTAPEWKQAVTSWFYCLDQDPATVPDGRCRRTSELRVEYDALEVGDWWFHIVSVGPDGVPGGSAAHFQVRVRAAGSLRGQVTKPNGILPLEGALLEAFKQGKSVAKTGSGKDGRFCFESLEPGDVLVKFDVPGLPALLVDGVKFDGSESVLNLSAECMAWPSPTRGAAQIRFAVLAKEAGKVGVKLYSESGQAIAEIEAPVGRPGYVKLNWNCAQAPEGSLLWQATAVSVDGKSVKFPIRKLKISH